MSKALDKLEATVTESAKKGTAVKNMSREQLLDYMMSVGSALRAHLQFFNDLGEGNIKLHDWMLLARKNQTTLQSVGVYNKLIANSTGIAKHRMEAAFCGGLVDTASAMASIMDELTVNISKLFTDKTFNLYNTKISHVAIYGMLEEANDLSKFMEAYICVFMHDRDSNLPKTNKAQDAELAKVEAISDCMSRTLNGKLGKTFAAAIARYKASGNDVCVLTADNQSSAKFAKLGNEVGESNIKSGCKGLHIFRIIGDFWTDFWDARARKQRALREQLKARVEYLQMTLDGVDPNSAEYKRVCQIIKNYGNEIDRLNQKIDAYYNED